MDCALGIVLGLGIGSYSAQHGLRDCLDATFHLTKKSAIQAKEKAAPQLARAHEVAMPYVKHVSANVSQQISAFQQNNDSWAECVHTHPSESKPNNFQCINHNGFNN
eukprot:CAMPEP_0172854942 /NCGR_PEP_ID=MMETSP1075-20121228/59417_1 /TAXON_ID=2916 /ORGANISM="Ceratium fusus, Strain PA161109" /LENGTH=106 /DNA_ID=CAMNT_0013701727 /DNA_START=59 /DNA_END=377 /DNA_ORIENTATION=-